MRTAPGVGLAEPAAPPAPVRSISFPQAGAILAGFALGVIPFLLLKFVGGKFPLDLSVYREAGHVFLHGGDVYGASFGSHLRVPLPFTYPPFAALVSVALFVVPKQMLAVAWTLMSLGTVLAFGVLVLRQPLARAGLGHPLVLGLATAALVWTIPVAQTITFGQVNLPLALACLVDCCWSRRHRGVLVGLATAIKLTPGLFILYFAVTKQWAAVLRATVTFALCQVVAGLLAPGPSREYWFHLFLRPDRTGNPSYFTNQSLYGLVNRLHLGAWLWPLLVLVVAALGMWRAVRAHKAGAEVAAVALIGLTGVLVSPISWQHHGVWILPVLAVLVAWAANAASWRLGRLALVVAVLVLFVAPLPLLGNHLLGAMPVLPRLAENSYLLVYLALIALLPSALVAAGTAPSGAPEATAAAAPG